MQRCTYRILGFAKSELEVSSLAFAIIVRFDDLREFFLKNVYLNGWEDVVGDDFAPQVEYVHDVLYDFRKYAHKPFSASEEVLEDTKKLNVGPIRTLFAGSAVLPDFGEIHPELNQQHESHACSDACFAALLDALLEVSCTGVHRR